MNLLTKKECEFKDDKIYDFISKKKSISLNSNNFIYKKNL